MSSQFSKEVPGHGSLRPIVAEYDEKRHGVRTELAELVHTTYMPSDHRYGNQKNGVPLQLVAGSTTPLVDKPGFHEMGGYDPFEHRQVSHPTSDLDTFIHLLKGSLGSGILAMPLAFYNAGLAFGVFATLIVGFICTYCVHVLVKCSQKLCQRQKVPSMGFSEIAEAAFQAGPPSLRKWSGFAGSTINLFLVVDLLGCCCVYIVFVARNLKQVVDFYGHNHWDIRIYMLFLLVPLLLLSLVRNLKYLAPFSMLANIFIATGLGITFYYIFTDLPSMDTVPNFATWHQLPLFFGTAIFALEGIGVVMPLENNMKTPQNFIGCPGVLNLGMFFVVVLYTGVGFFGYLKYGDATQASITLNLPTEEILAQSVKVMIAIAIFLTYGLQFYVPMEIIWKRISHRFGEKQLVAEYVTRIVLVSATVGIAVAIPNLGPFISLVGAVCLSTLGLMFPAIIEIVVYWDVPGMGTCNWRLIKNVFIILFGVLGFVTGTYTSIEEIIAEFGLEK